PHVDAARDRGRGTKASPSLLVGGEKSLITRPMTKSESMFPKPRQDLVPNPVEFERLPLVKATGFREYDARWRFPEEINLLGLEAVGLGLATLMHQRGVPLRAVVGHDFPPHP